MTRASKAKEGHARHPERRGRTAPPAWYRSGKLWAGIVAAAALAAVVLLALRKPAGESSPAADQRASGAPVPLSEAPTGEDPGPRRTAVPDSRMINVSDDPVKGPADARVRIVEFADFQCPSCAQFFLNTGGSLNALYGDRIQWVFMDFPLQQHERAIPAAVGAQCAHRQGKFWPYHDLVFRNQGRMSDSELERYAGEVGLDVQQWKTCFESRETLAGIQEDAQLGSELGVDATPTFFVGGQTLKGAMPITSFMEIIDPILQQQAASAGGGAGATDAAREGAAAGAGSTASPGTPSPSGRPTSPPAGTRGGAGDTAPTPDAEEAPGG